MNKTTIAVTTGLVGAALSLAACSSSAGGSGSSGSSSAMTSAAMSGSNAAMTTTFGSGCASVPKSPSNPGSFSAMSKVPVATAASGNPILSTLVKAVGAANLGDTLNNAKNITVFAPDNNAFTKIPAATLKKVLADKAALTKILSYHVVGQRITPDQLHGTFKTLEGSTLKIGGQVPSMVEVGPTGKEASVVCGNIQTANATVYIIDSVMMPKN